MLMPIATYTKSQKLSFKSPELKDIKNRFIALNQWEKYEFYRLLYINILSWVTIEEALLIIKNATWFQKVEEIAWTCLRDLWTWLEFWKTLEMFDRSFTEKEVWLIKTWEETWKITIILHKLIEDIERAKKVKWEVKAALVMPVITLVVTFIAVYILLTYVMPMFVESFEKAWTELPWLTKFVLAISNFLVAYPWSVFLWVFALWWFLQIFNFWKWRVLKHKLLLNAWPLSRNFIIPYELANFITTLELMVSSWVDIIESFKKSANAVANVHLKEEVNLIYGQLVKWDWFWWALSQFKEKDKRTWKISSTSKLMNLTVISVLQVWDKNWYLSNVLTVQKNLTNEEIMFNIKSVSKMIEPMMVIVIAAFIIPIILAIMLPYFWQITNMIEWI